MTEKFTNLKDNLRDFEEDSGIPEGYLTIKDRKRVKSGRWLQYILLGALVFSFLIFVERQYEFNVISPFQNLVASVNTPSQSLLDAMGRMLEEMGYEALTTEELIELRAEGVTATYISRVKDLGYDDLSLNDAVRLQQAGVSTTFMTMMHELGYENLTVDDFIRLRRYGVTAYFTSNMHDLGYTEIEMDELIRLRDIGVTTALVERLQQDSDGELTLEEIIRYRISNQ